MMRSYWAMLALVALAGLVGLLPSSVPFYGSPDLTPRWHGTFHRVDPSGLYSPPAQPHVVRFFFTRCGSLCPTLTRHLRAVPVPVLSISVAEDSPEEMQAYARREGLPAWWIQITGPRARIHRFARESLFCGAEDFRRSATGQEVLHSEKVFLVDGQGRLRGVYNGSLALESEHLREDVQKLNSPATICLPGL